MNEEPPTLPQVPEHALKLYTLAVEMADRVSARRATANSFFLTIQTGLAAALAAFTVRVGSDGAAPEPDRFVLALAAVAGLILALAWWLLLRSYRKLNGAKFQVINKIEEQYFQIRPFLDEWAFLKAEDPARRRWRDRYAELGFIEQAVPACFGVLYLILALYVGLR